jgi:hypothetical protein
MDRAFAARSRDVRVEPASEAPTRMMSAVAEDAEPMPLSIIYGRSIRQR